MAAVAAVIAKRRKSLNENSAWEHRRSSNGSYSEQHYVDPIDLVLSRPISGATAGVSLILNQQRRDRQQPHQDKFDATLQLASGCRNSFYEFVLIIKRVTFSKSAWHSSRGFYR